MSEQEPSNSQAYKIIERRIRSLRERRERQRLHLDTVLAAYNLLGAEIKRAEEELAQAG